MAGAGRYRNGDARMLWSVRCDRSLVLIGISVALPFRAPLIIFFLELRGAELRSCVLDDPFEGEKQRCVGGRPHDEGRRLLTR